MIHTPVDSKPKVTCRCQNCSIYLKKSSLVYNCGFFVNLLVPGRSECDSKNVIFNLVLLIVIFRSSHDNVLQWMTQDLTDDKSSLVQVMAWCHQATSYYLSQCRLSSLSTYGIARPQWVNSLDPYDNISHENWVNIGSGNSLVPDGTKPLPVLMQTYH